MFYLLKNILQIETVSSEILEQAWSVSPTTVYAFLIVILILTNITLILAVVRLYKDKEKEKKDKDELAKETVSLLTVLESKFTNFDDVKSDMSKIKEKIASTESLLKIIYDKFK